MTEDTSQNDEKRTENRANHCATGSVLSDGGQSFKVLGELAKEGGIGVLGRNIASSGTTYGVKGEVESSDGYGIATPDDVRVEGELDTAATDFVVQAGTTTTADAQNVVTGHTTNAVRNGATGGTISGGGYNDGNTDESNTVYDNYGTVGGGRNNQAGTNDSNPDSTRYATVSGGKGNVATERGTTVGGGIDNGASSSMATVAGGSNNSASGQFAAVPGGSQNNATGDLSFAAGLKANADHDGSVVFGDSSLDSISSQQQDEARFQMPCYAPDFTVTSTRTAKTDIKPVSSEAVLEGLESLDVSTWKFTDTDSGRHMGPIAEDFHETFGLGSDEKHISTLNAIGVSIAAIQGLSKKLDNLQDDLTSKEERIETLETENRRKDERIQTLEERLAAVEDAIGVSGDVPTAD